MWPLFPSVTHFSNGDHFFQVWHNLSKGDPFFPVRPIFTSVTFLPSVTRFSNVTRFSKYGNLFSSCSGTAAILLLHCFIIIIILEKRSDYNIETDNFLRIFWVSAHSKRQWVNTWDFGLEWSGKRDFKSVFSVKSLSREELCDSLLLNLDFSTVLACPRFLAISKVVYWLLFCETLQRT